MLKCRAVRHGSFNSPPLCHSEERSDEESPRSGSPGCPLCGDPSGFALRTGRRAHCAKVPGSSSRSACTHIPVGRAFRRVGRAEMGGFARPTAICVRASSRPHPYARRPGVSRRRSQAALRRIFAGGSLVCSPFFTLVHSSRTISGQYLTILSNADKRPVNSRIVIM